MEEAVFVFNKHRDMNFTYNKRTHEIGLPCKLGYTETDLASKREFTTIFHWIINAINHEYLHKLLHEFISYDTTSTFDTFYYGDMICGFIDSEKI